MNNVSDLINTIQNSATSPSYASSNSSSLPRDRISTLEEKVVDLANKLDTLNDVVQKVQEFVNMPVPFDSPTNDDSESFEKLDGVL